MVNTPAPCMIEVLQWSPGHRAVVRTAVAVSSVVSAVPRAYGADLMICGRHDELEVANTYDDIVMALGAAPVPAPADQILDQAGTLEDAWAADTVKEGGESA